MKANRIKKLEDLEFTKSEDRNGYSSTKGDFIPIDLIENSPDEHFTHVLETVTSKSFIEMFPKGY